MKVWIYRSVRRAETYLYLPGTLADSLAALPAALVETLGRLEPVMELELHADRRLARTDPRAVLRDLRARGYHLQLPPASPLPGGGH